MPDPTSIVDPSLVRADDRDAPLSTAEGQALLRACYEQYSKRLFESVRASLDLAGDLFEAASGVADGEVAGFASKRREWIERFEQAIADSYARRIEGQPRSGRRPDSGGSAATLSVLTPFDEERQAALVAATAFLHQFTKTEQDALDMRIGTLLPAVTREFDNPFGPAYLLDALGLTSRAVYPNPRDWRPLMQRVLADITPAVNKIYISLNRLLGDRGVLPGIKAALRARSQWRPADDRDLLPTFTRMLSDSGKLPADFGVLPLSGPASDKAAPAAAAAPRAAGVTVGAGIVSPEILAGLAALAATGARAAPGAIAASSSDAPGDFRDLPPALAVGTSTPLFATLGHWQRLDLPAAIARTIPQPAGGGGATVLPLNLVPHIRAVVNDQVVDPADRIAMDVIALLFDPIFRDESIPDRQRRLFGRLQVPIVKAALLDRTFFSDHKHPARRLLDRLADAAIGATADEAYGDVFEAAATRIVDDVCRDFEIDVAVFEHADATLTAFVDAERREAAPALKDNVATALASEEGDADRSQVRALLRDRLAGLDLPFDVRAFAETVWADYLTALRRDNALDSEPWRGALATLDDLLWSILVKERSAQKARLTKMVPGLVASLRRGCATVAVPADRTRSFFDTLYTLHMAAIKPAAVPARGAASTAASTLLATRAKTQQADRPPVPVAPAAALPGANVHDFVSEMAVGTWLAFGSGENVVNARLTWVSPLRSKYIFTSRSRTQAYVFSPEDLAWELGAGRATLVVEPVPLFDRAVSAALDTLAATRPPGAAVASAA